VRLAYWFCRRKVGRVIEPVRLHAHHPRLLRGLAGMEMAQEAARAVDPLLKALAQLRVATRIGCPF
jgi:alkylhydroperoxidase family enzyme